MCFTIALAGASLTYDTSSINYDHNMFIIQATDLMFVGKARSLPKSGENEKYFDFEV
jgi:hypothetical protein